MFNYRVHTLPFHHVKTLSFLLFFLCASLATAQSLQIIQSDSCQTLYDRAKSDIQGNRWNEAYTKFKSYIAICYVEYGAFHAFGNLDFVNQNRSDNFNRYPEHREWLK